MMRRERSSYALRVFVDARATEHLMYISLCLLNRSRARARAGAYPGTSPREGHRPHVECVCRAVLFVLYILVLYGYAQSITRKKRAKVLA